MRVAGRFREDVVPVVDSEKYAGSVTEDAVGECFCSGLLVGASLPTAIIGG
jgi:hypothetical protein